MTIDHNNIEEYLLDYLEGNLDALHMAELMAFLAENPEYEALIRNTSRYNLISSHDLFPDARLLKKNFRDVPEINSANFDEFCIAASEGLLDARDAERLNRYIGEDGQKLKNLELFHSLKLKPDNSIHFPGKDKLKKSRGFHMPLRYLYYGLAVAASIALMLLLTWNKSPRVLPVPSIVTSAENTTRDDKNQTEPILNTEPYYHAEKVSSPPVIKEARTVESVDNPATMAIINMDAGDEINYPQLKPVPGRIYSSLNNNNLDINLLKPALVTPEIKPERRPQIESENLFALISKKINFWKTAETAISGFNYLTEANISIDKITDNEGRLTRLTLNTESYSIEGKLK